VTGSLSLEASYFSIVTRDRIVWTPTSGSFWSPKNIGVVDSRGVEAEARWTDPRDIVSLSLNSTWMKVRKKSEDYPGDPSTGKLLIYLPQQTVNAEASAGFPNLRFLLQYSWVSFRFTTEINDRFLPSYGLLNAAVRCAVPAGPVKVSFKVEVTNVLDTSYQVIALYPMPLREVRGTLGVEL
jgi:iron complex outermembrane receptor protein